jgi:hypothetical protein
VAAKRKPGKYGRRPPVHRRALWAGEYLTGYVPEHPPAADYIEPLGGGWKMLGNDRAGDCVAVTWASVRRLITATLAGTEAYPSQEEVWEFYRTQNPGFNQGGASDTDGPGSPQDQGMVIQTALERLVNVGGPDGMKALGFAQVAVHNLDEARAALAVAGFLWVGLNVTEANEAEFSADQPWAAVPGSPVAGGHSVMAAGYGPAGAGALGGDVRIQTWAAESSFTDELWLSQVEEAWMVIWPEHLQSREFLLGLDVEEFAADYTAITGRPFPAPLPGPPVPVTPPAEQDRRDVSLLADLRSWMAEGHHGDNRRAVARIRAWAESKGLPL